MTDKTVVIPDVHGRQLWKEVVNKESPNRVIFLGDYFDSFDIETEDQVRNFLDIIQFKKESGIETEMIIGNHDHHYMVGDSGIAGFQPVGYYLIQPELRLYKTELKAAYRMGNIIFSHAGISPKFLNDVFGKEGWTTENMVDLLNDMMFYKPMAFMHCGMNPYGDSQNESCIWIRPRSLMMAARPFQKEGIVQIVGHTGLDGVKTKANKHYWFTDALFEPYNEYVTIEDGVIIVKTLRNDNS